MRAKRWRKPTCWMPSLCSDWSDAAICCLSFIKAWVGDWTERTSNYLFLFSLVICCSSEAVLWGGGCFWLNKMEIRGKQSHCDAFNRKKLGMKGRSNTFYGFRITDAHILNEIKSFLKSFDIPLPLCLSRSNMLLVLFLLGFWCPHSFPLVLLSTFYVSPKLK